MWVLSIRGTAIHGSLKGDKDLVFSRSNFLSALLRETMWIESDATT